MGKARYTRDAEISTSIMSGICFSSTTACPCLSPLDWKFVRDTSTSATKVWMDRLTRTLRIASRRHRRLQQVLLLLLLAYGIDLAIHLRSFLITAPQSALDIPFAKQCTLQDSSMHSRQPTLLSTPLDIDEPRENATIMVLARNSDIKGVVASIKSLEEQWNQWYHYPIVFLNDRPWKPNLMEAVRKVTASEVTFEQIPISMWSWPKNADGSDMIDREKAAVTWKKMEAAGLPYVSVESYHHMCRFFSGFFFDHPAMAKYRYFWRVEPDVEFTCKIPYDPFRSMRRNGNIYGYTMALWEVGSTCPSLFRTTAEYKESQGIITTSVWTSMMSASWAPLPFRWLVMSIQSIFHSRDRYGDAWNHCHFWSNFEIADMEFFRSEQYRSYFAALDRAGGFFTERWGDAPMHSLALGLFARPEQLHYFEDIGYSHPPFQNCPPKGVGCNCTCDRNEGQIPTFCLDRLREGVGR